MKCMVIFRDVFLWKKYNLRLKHFAFYQTGNWLVAIWTYTHNLFHSLARDRPGGGGGVLRKIFFFLCQCLPPWKIVAQNTYLPVSTANIWISGNLRANPLKCGAARAEKGHHEAKKNPNEHSAGVVRLVTLEMNCSDKVCMKKLPFTTVADTSWKIKPLSSNQSLVTANRKLIFANANSQTQTQIRKRKLQIRNVCLSQTSANSNCGLSEIVCEMCSSLVIVCLGDAVHTYHDHCLLSGYSDISGPSD